MSNPAPALYVVICYLGLRPLHQRRVDTSRTSLERAQQGQFPSRPLSQGSGLAIPLPVPAVEDVSAISQRHHTKLIHSTVKKPACSFLHQ